MQVHITAKYKSTEDISDCLETVSKAIENFREHHSVLYSPSDEDIKVDIEPMDNSYTFSSKYDIENFINFISERLESRSHNQK